MEHMKINNDKIRIYLDNIFASLPKTEQAVRMKEEMYCSMLDKYNGLVEAGESEDAAFGRIVGEFGSIEEIRSELSPAPVNTAASAPAKLTLPASKETEMAYEKYRIFAAVLIAVAVILFIFAPLGYQSYEQLFASGTMTNFVFGSAIAVGVMLCVKAVVGGEKYFELVRKPEYDVLPSPERVEAYRKFAAVRSWLMGLAVGMFVLSPFARDLSESDLVLGGLIAVGVAILIILAAVRKSYRDVVGEHPDKKD